MGLLKNIKLGNGISLEDAYYRIGLMTGDKEKIDIRLDVYKDRQSFIDDVEKITSVSHTLMLDVSDDAYNFYRQVYVKLKKMDEYAEAVDVFENGQRAIPS